MLNGNAKQTVAARPSDFSSTRSMSKPTGEETMRKSERTLHEYLKLHLCSPVSQDSVGTDGLDELERILAAGVQVGEKNTHNETALHVATSSRLPCPTNLLNKLISAASPKIVKIRDSQGRAALDRLIQLQDREISKETLELFGEKSVDFLSGSDDVPSPLIGLIQRKHDGHRNLKFVLGRDLSLAGKSNLHEDWPLVIRTALKDGSAKTLEALLDYGEEKMLPIVEPLLHGALTTTFELNEKVDILLKRGKGKNLLLQKDSEERNWLHAVAEHKPPWLSRACDVLQSDLDISDVCMPDKQGDTPLHKAAINYAQLDSENSLYVKALQTLLTCSAQYNARNKFGLTPLQCLLAKAKFTPSHGVLDLFFDGFLINENVEEVTNPHEYFPLATLARRQDGSSLLDYVKTKEPNKLKAHLQYMLEVAVSEGYVEMVQDILKCDFSISASDWSSLLLQASLSQRDPAEKMRRLCERKESVVQVETETESNSMLKQEVGRSLLHAAAGSKWPSVDALAIAIERLQVNVSQPDADGSTALHIAAGNQNEGSLACVNYLLTKETTIKNPGESPLPMTALGSLLNSLFTLKDDDSLPRDAKEKVITLLEKGVSIEDLRDDLYWIGHQHNDSNCDCKYESSGVQLGSRNPPKPKILEKLFLDPEVIISPANPLYLLLVIGECCQNHVESLQEKKWRDGDKAMEETLWTEILKWKALNKKLETEAIALITEFEKHQTKFRDVMTEIEICLAHVIGWKKFLSLCSVSSSLQEIFWGHTTAGADETEKEDQWYFETSGWREKWQHSHNTVWEPVHLFFLLLVFHLQTIYLPFVLLFNAIRGGACSRNGKSARHWRMYLLFPPGKIPLVTWTAHAIGYIVFVVTLISRIASEPEREGGMTAYDWVIIVYIISLFGQEWRQLRAEKRKYIRRPSNLFDLGTLILLVTGYVIRGVGLATSGGAEPQAVYLRVSEILIGFTSLLACLRLLGYLMIFRTIGTIQTSFQKIGKNVLYFLVILGVFLLAFAVGITGVYKGSIYNGEEAPKAVNGVWSSLVTLYWSLFGMIGFTDLSRENDDVTAPSVEMDIALCIFALWLLVSIIVLLNMLIALINYAFEDAHQNTALIWNKSYISVIKEMRQFYPFPIPLNLVQILADILYFCRNPKRFWDPAAVFEDEYCFTCRVGKTQNSRSQVLLMKEAYKMSLNGFDTDTEKDNSQQFSSKFAIAELKEATRREFEELNENNLKFQQRIESLLIRDEERSKRQATACQDKSDSYEDQHRSSAWRRDSELLDFSPLAEKTERSLPGSSNSGEEASVIGTDLLAETASTPVPVNSGSSEKEGVEARLLRPDLYKVVYTPDDHFPIGTFRAINHPISKCKYFEVKITKLGGLGVGLTPADYPKEMQPGWGDGSIGLHVGDGTLFVRNGIGEALTSSFLEGDCIGCGVNEQESPHPDEELMVYFLRRRDGQLETLCKAMSKVPPSGLFPTVGMTNESQKVEAFLLLVRGKPPLQMAGINEDGVDETVHRFISDSNGYVWRGVYFRSKTVCYVSDGFNSVGVCQHQRNECKVLEVRIVNLGNTGDIYIGYAPKDEEFRNQPGWSRNSVAFRCSDGCLYKGYSFGMLQIGAPALERDVIKCEKKIASENDGSGTVTFWRNNVKLQEIKMEDVYSLYPTIGMRSEEAVVMFDTNYDESDSKNYIRNRSPNIQVYGDVIVSSGDGREQGSCQWKEGISRKFSFFDVEILSTGDAGKISIGLAENGFPYYRLPGLVPGSVGYHCDSGKLLEGYGRGSGRAQVFEQGTVIRCGVEGFFNSGALPEVPETGSMVTVFFTINGGAPVNSTKIKWPKMGFYPTVGLVSNGEVVCITPGAARKQKQSSSFLNPMYKPRRR